MQRRKAAQRGEPAPTWGGARAGAGAPVIVPGGAIIKTASLSQNQWDALDAAATRMGVRRSVVLRMILADYGFEP